MPTTSDIAAIASGEIVAARKKSLNPIATHCLSRTATQKVGREYSRNDRKMIP